MHKVVSMIEYRYRETIAILRYLLRMAMRGELEGMALCFRRAGKIEYAFTGRFKDDHNEGLKAASRIEWKMNQALDATESTL